MMTLVMVRCPGRERCCHCLRLVATLSPGERLAVSAAWAWRRRYCYG
jgi:hypothetical protein